MIITIAKKKYRFIQTRVSHYKLTEQKYTVYYKLSFNKMCFLFSFS